jgi:hypothetical protein
VAVGPLLARLRGRAAALAHPGRGALLVRELKANGRAKISREQAEWLAELEACGVDAGVWRPDDWDEIVSVLR